MHRPPRLLLALLLGLPLTAACGSDAEPETDPIEASAPPGVVTITSRALDFDAPDTVAPGWTTFEFVNASPMVHFAIVEKLPDGIGLEEQQAQVAPPFQQGMDGIVAGDMDGAMAAFGQLPEWFGQVVFAGGPGLTSPGQTSSATVELEPGTYLLECYVKTGEVFHSFPADPAIQPMVHEFVVTGERTDRSEPTTDLEIAITSEGGFTLEGSPAAGSNTFRVRVVDQAQYANFVGHDVHVVRLGDGVDAVAVQAWMNWSVPGGLNSPAPATFVGGLNDMAAGTTGYFTVNLEPGTYALVAEVPDPQSVGMFVTFEVPAG